MPGTAQDRKDFFLSRRGSVSAVAREVADARDLVVLFTADYEASPYTRKEFTSFEANRAQDAEERRVVILRCEDVPLRGLFAPNVYQDLVGVTNPKERAERILAAAEGRSQGLKPPPRPFVGVPPRAVGFTGRSDELDRLDAILISGKAAAVTQAKRETMSGAETGRVAVQGMGGVGKTTLAAEYAHRYRDLYSGVWWCPAETRDTLVRALAAMAEDLGVRSTDSAAGGRDMLSEAQPSPVEKAAKAGLRRLSEQRGLALLVYDNVASPDDIADLLPASGARVLITSRFLDWSAWAEEVALDVLPLEEAGAFLERRAGRTDAEGARALAETLGGLPLALDHAAATCKRTQMRFVEYAAKVGTMIASAPRGTTYPRSVAATFDLAISEAIKHCPAAEQMMAFLSQCAPERIPMVLVRGAIDDEVERQAALLELTEVSLVKNDPFPNGEPAITVHRLVQAVMGARPGPSKAKLEATDRVAARLLLILKDYHLFGHLSFAITRENLTPAGHKLLQMSGWTGSLGWCLTKKGDKDDPDDRYWAYTLCRNCRSMGFWNVRDDYPPSRCRSCGLS